MEDAFHALQQQVFLTNNDGMILDLQKHSVQSHRMNAEVETTASLEASQLMNRLFDISGGWKKFSNEFAKHLGTLRHDVDQLAESRNEIETEVKLRFTRVANQLYRIETCMAHAAREHLGFILVSVVTPMKRNLSRRHAFKTSLCR